MKAAPLAVAALLSFGLSAAVQAFVQPPGPAPLASTIRDPAIRPKPNILLFVVDDAGKEAYDNWGGGAWPENWATPGTDTPALDALEAHGVRFNHFYVSDSCAPTRTQLLTGMLNHRTQSFDSGSGPTSIGHYPLQRVMRLGDSGYRMGAFGKLGVVDTHYQGTGTGPGKYAVASGFDYYEGEPGSVTIYDSWMHYRHEYDPREADRVKSSSEARSGFTDDDAVAAAIEWINAHEEATPRVPLMLWLGLHLPHDILGPKTAVRVPGSQTDCEADPGRCRLEMIEYADVLLGRVVAALDDPDDWIIFFIGDNGQTQTAPWPPISCPNLQAKNSITECGVNVPLVVGYGGIAESRPAPTTDALTMGVDIFSTVLDFAGVSWDATHMDPDPLGHNPMLKGQPIVRDGISLRESLLGRCGGRWGCSESRGHEVIFSVDPAPHNGWVAFDGEYKYQRGYGNPTPDSCWNIPADPWQTQNLCTSGDCEADLTGEVRLACLALRDALEAKRSHAVDLSFSIAPTALPEYPVTGEKIDFQIVSNSDWKEGAVECLVYCGAGQQAEPQFFEHPGSFLASEVCQYGFEGEGEVEVHCRLDEFWQKEKLSFPIAANRPPDLQATVHPLTADTRTLVVFDALQSSDPDGRSLDFYWEFGDGETGVEPVESHEYAAEGLYEVRLTISDSGGESREGSWTVAILEPADVGVGGLGLRLFVSIVLMTVGWISAKKRS